MTTRKNVTIGIDLGTTYSCVAYCLNGKPTVVVNGFGKETTPSYITIPGPEDDDEDEDDNCDGDSWYTGQASKDAASQYPQETIFDVKRLIGRKFTDPCVQRDMKFWPFEVTPDPTGVSPQIKVNGTHYNPEELSAKILLHLKRRAEDVLGCEVKDVVITVPAYFNDGQRQATRDAGSIAGLNVLQIINEPTAAALAYNLHRKKTESPRNCLVFDLGGGTFDVSVLSLEKSTIRVLAVGGNTHLGGEDFDNAMVDYCLQEFKKEFQIDIHEIRKNLENTTANAKTKAKVIRSLRRLKNECEQQKQFLSATTKVVVAMDAFYGDKMLKVVFTRELFETINNKYFTECSRIVTDTLKSSKLTKEAIDDIDIVMVGGSSRIPKIQTMLSELFGGKTLLNWIDKDLAVAQGAAIQAATLTVRELNSDTENSTTSTNSTSTTSVSVIDVVPLSIGVEMDRVMGGDNSNFDVLIPKNTPIPHRMTKEFATTADNVRTIRINIFEGQSRFTRENHLLGNFTLKDLPRCPQGEPIVVTMEVDREGILHVSAKLPRQRIQSQISITEHKGRLTKEQIEQMKTMTTRRGK